MPTAAFRQRAGTSGQAGCLLVSIALLLGCARPDPLVTYDLAHSLPTARPVRADLRLDFGVSSARGSLLSGWSWNETSDGGSTFVWGIGPESLVRLTLNGLRPTELRFRARALAGDETGSDAGSNSGGNSGSDAAAAARRAVEIAIGELPLASARVSADFAEHRLAVDPDAWPATDVVLRLRYRPPPPPAGSGRNRRLAVAWDWLELALPATASPPTGLSPRLAGRARIELPRAVRLDYAVDLEPGSRLVLDEVLPSPSALLVVLTPRDGEPRLLRLAPAAGDDVVLDLGIERFTVATLSLLADPGVLVAGEHLALEHPRIVRAGVL
ncbi:MAG TPA: hypothetical protein VMT85_03545 [Thermoanaerobaculia bacterium]|nr:hypothetical protein [Thermoanaerobaculia bacterium]